MFNKDELLYISKMYGKTISRIIDSNVKYYPFNRTIKWCFGDDDNTAIVAVCDKKTDIISINAHSFLKSLNEDNLRTIEYYLLHEIRHVYQHLAIREYENNNEAILQENIIKKWIFERDNYIKSLDEKGNENPAYFKQDSEMDAFGFSLAVMKYKYNDVKDLYIPPMYGVEFNNLVNEWLETFKSEKL